MNIPGNPETPANPSVHVDDNEASHLYVNTSSVTPSIDECIVDLGISSVAMPAGMEGQPMTPEVAAAMKVVFRHQGRVYLNWPAAKRMARLLTATVQAHEKAFGEITLLEEREDLAAKAAAEMAGGSPDESAGS